jgi:hypothetical protein
MKPAEFIIEFRDTGDPLGLDRDSEYRLRQVLKALLRSYGFRVVSVRPAPPGANNQLEPSTQGGALRGREG